MALTFLMGRSQIFVKHSLISCLVILGAVRKMAKAGCVAVAFRADTIVSGMCGIHMRNCFVARDAMMQVKVHETMSRRNFQMTKTGALGPFERCQRSSFLWWCPRGGVLAVVVMGRPCSLPPDFRGEILSRPIRIEIGHQLPVHHRRTAIHRLASTTTVNVVE